MRPRTFILLILVLVLAAVAVVLFIASNSGGLFGGGDDNGTDTTVDTSGEGTSADNGEVPVAPIPTATPAVFLESVVIARANLPVGTRLTEELLAVEQRPNTNIALQGGYTFASIDEVVGSLIKVGVQRGDAILRPMIALESSDLASFGSDLSLYVDRGKVAIAFPFVDFAKVGDQTDEERVLNQQVKGLAFAMRPGDLVDLLMTSRIIEIDSEFRTPLPNQTERVIESELLEGFLFFFPQTAEGRLEFIPEINQVIEIIPGSTFLRGQDFPAGSPIPKRVTQLTVQQAEVLWVGTWYNRQELEQAAFGLATANVEEGQPIELGALPERFNLRPDVVILSMPPQDALAVKWAIERGVDIDLALRAQGDTQTFSTTSISLFQIVEQGGVVVPPPVDFDLFPPPSKILIPRLPSAALNLNIVGEEIEVGEEIFDTDENNEGQ